jgi:hypothetical protein
MKFLLCRTYVNAMRVIAVFDEYDLAYECLQKCKKTYANG